MAQPTATFSAPSFYDDLASIQFDLFAADLAQRIPAGQCGDVLEVACGTGIVTRRLRERLDPSARLVATDLAEPMVAYARSRHAGLDVEWREADALQLPFADGTFDLVVCGFGVMFFPERAAGLREARRVLRSGGRLLFSVWDAIEHNPHAEVFARTVEPLFPGDPQMKFRTPYELADAGLLRELVEATGFRVQRIQTRRIPIVDADPRQIARGQTKGTPRAALLAQRGVPLDEVVDAVAAALTAAGGNPYNGHAQAITVEAEAEGH